MKHTGFETAERPEEMPEAEQREFFFNEVQFLVFTKLNLDFSSETLKTMEGSKLMNHLSILQKLSTAMAPILDRWGRVMPDTSFGAENADSNSEDKFDKNKLDDPSYREEVALAVIEVLRTQNASVIKEIEDLQNVSLEKEPEETSMEFRQAA